MCEELFNSVKWMTIQYTLISVTLQQRLPKNPVSENLLSTLNENDNGLYGKRRAEESPKHWIEICT